MVPLDQAEAYFSEQIQPGSGSAFAYLMRGVVRFENGDLEKAAADLDAALKLEPKNVSALIARAQLWQWRNRLDLAMADASQAIELDSHNSYAYVERGVFEYDLKKHDKAVDDLDKATELGSPAAVIHITRGMMLMEQGKLAKAQLEFNQAIQLDPKHPDAYSGYASLYLIRGNSKAAILVLDQAIAADPQSPESHGNRAIVFLSIGNYDKALDDLDEVIRFAPNSARALRERAWILATCPDAKIRKPDEARTSATRACELTEWNEPQTLMTLAAACSETGDFSTAVKWQQKAVDLLAAKSPEKFEYRKLLDRYKASKPYHRRSILEESGIQIPGLAAKKSETTAR
jgi:tetratricopeptide (TPR) repeat protein